MNTWPDARCPAQSLRPAGGGPRPDKGFLWKFFQLLAKRLRWRPRIRYTLPMKQKSHPPRRGSPAPQARRNAPPPPPPRRGAPAPQQSARRESEMPRSWRQVAGTHAINEAFRVSGKKAKVLWLRQGWESNADLQSFEEQAKNAKVRIEVKSGAVLDKLCATNQGAILYIDGRLELDYQSLTQHERSTLLLLDGLEDPHNLGAILRTAWLAGAHGLMIPSERAVGLTPTVHKVACGGAEHVPVDEITNFSVPLEVLKEQGYWVFGLSHKATKTIFDLKLPEKVVWAIGSEEKGLRVSTERLCDELVSIPQSSNAASYNASVAAGMALAETIRSSKRQV